MLSASWPYSSSPCCVTIRRGIPILDKYGQASWSSQVCCCQFTVVGWHELLRTRTALDRFLGGPPCPGFITSIYRRICRIVANMAGRARVRTVPSRKTVSLLTMQSSYADADASSILTNVTPVFLLLFWAVILVVSEPSGFLLLLLSIRKLFSFELFEINAHMHARQI